jgi:lipopolysaccharide export system protein LptA
MRKLFFIMALAAAVGIAVEKLLAQSTPQISISEGMVQQVPYDPPNESHIKYEIRFSDLTPHGEGKELVKNMILKQFALTGGAPQMVAEAPECLMDPKTKEFSSAGPLKVHAQEGKVFIEGRGFEFLQNDSVLVISNDAHSIIDNQTGTNLPVKTEIFSRHARFEMKTDATNGTAVYERDVHVKDPRIDLTSDYLFADLPRSGKGQSNRLSYIVAKTNVVMDFLNPQGERSHATAEKAVYNSRDANGATNDLLELTGNPRVTLTNGWMTADLFLVNRATGALQGQDNFHFHYLPQIMAGKTNTEEADIYADRFDYDMGTRVAKFNSVWGHVRVRDTRMKLDCDQLVANLPKAQSGANHFDHIVADKDVTMDFPDEKTGQNIHATGQKAVYDFKVANGRTNEVLDLTGEPALETEKYSARMTADRIHVDSGLGTIRGIGHQHSTLKKKPDEPATMDTDVFSEELESFMDTGLSIYSGGVRAFDPEMNLTSEKLTVKSVRGTKGSKGHLDNIVAEGNVAIDFVSEPFSATNIVNLQTFALRLKQPGDFDEVGQFVSGQLTPPTKALLGKYSGGTNEASGLKGVLAAELNRIAKSENVYESNRFDHVVLSKDTIALMNEHPMGVDRVELNRLLLLDAFPGEIERGEQGEKTHATGDRAMFAYVPMGATTNRVLDLTGHPRLDKPDLWVTADDAIVFDQTTGVSRYVGQPHFHLKFGGFTGLKTPNAEKKQPEKKQP